MPNEQLIEKQVDDLYEIDLHSMFYTIQGEGPFAGRPAVFVRLAGCNLQCPLCDTDYTSKRIKLTPKQLVSRVLELVPETLPRPLVVITGGEPFRQNLYALVFWLVAEGFPVQIETNGTLYQELPWADVTVVCSPKTGSLNKNLIPHIAAFKYVLQAGSVSRDDGLPLLALGHPNSGRVARPPRGFSGIIYLQPVDMGSAKTVDNPHLAACIRSCMTHGYTLGIQLHKHINLA